MEEKLVSIIIPVYNAEKYLEACIKGVKNQTYNFIECILINDGSKDGSEDIIKKLIKDDNRFKYIYQQNGGPSKARNMGIKAANGEYIAFVDADDRIETNYIEILINGIKNCDIACCGYIDESNYGIISYSDFSNDRIGKNKKEFIRSVINGTGGVLWAKIFKTDIIKQNKIRLDENLYQSEDMIFVLEYMQYVEKWAIIEQYIYHYNRFNESSISSNISDEYLENYEQFYRELYSKLQLLKFEKREVEDYMNNKVADTLFFLVMNSKNREKLCDKILRNPMFVQVLEQTEKYKKVNKFIIKHNYMRLNAYAYCNKVYLKIRGALGSIVRRIRN